MASSVNDASYSSAVEISRIILLAIVPIVIILTMLANGAYIITLLKKPSLHTPSNTLLGALAVSDVFVATVAEPAWLINIFYTTNGQVLTNASSNLNTRIMFFFVLLSFFNIVSVSFDRYMAIFHPFWYHAKATCKTHLMVAIAVFATSILVYIPLALNAKKQLTTASYIYIALISLSLTITGYCNMNIFSFIRHRIRQVRAIPNGTNGEGSGHFAARGVQEKNKAVIIAIITVLFITCYMPFSVYIAIADFDKTAKTNSEVLGSWWSIIFVLLNSLLNPIVYYVRMKSVRDAFKELLCNRRSQLDEV